MPDEDVLGEDFFTANSMYPDWRAPITETANADRLVARYGDEIRYCSDRKVWCVWNGKAWNVDDIGGVMRRMEDVARSIYIEASDEKDTDRRKALGGWAKQSESRRSQENAVALARYKRDIEVQKFSSVFDTMPLVINANNGTIDLFTGELRPFKREDFLTRTVPIDYDSGAECPKFLEFIGKALPGDGLTNYIARLAGYCLTGSISEQAWFMFYGVTMSGKSTLITILRGLLGPSALTLPENYFLVSKDTTDYTTATLAGVRLATCVESNENKRLDVAKVKALTGGDAISAALKYQNQFEFKPQVKLILATNHRPRVPDTDESIWRRMHLVPFMFSVPEDERVMDFSETLLRDEAPGILKWAVEGCQSWLANGLTQPKAMKDACEEYRSTEDIVQNFVTERCVRESINDRVLQRELFSLYVAWAKENAIRQLTKTRFTQELGRLGIPTAEDKRHYMGIKIS